MLKSCRFLIIGFLAVKLIGAVALYAQSASSQVSTNQHLKIPGNAADLAKLEKLVKEKNAGSSQDLKALLASVAKNKSGSIKDVTKLVEASDSNNPNTLKELTKLTDQAGQNNLGSVNDLTKLLASVNTNKLGNLTDVSSLLASASKNKNANLNDLTNYTDAFGAKKLGNLSQATGLSNSFGEKQLGGLSGLTEVINNTGGTQSGSNQLDQISNLLASNDTKSVSDLTKGLDATASSPLGNTPVLTGSSPTTNSNDIPPPSETSNAAASFGSVLNGNQSSANNISSGSNTSFGSVLNGNLSSATTISSVSNTSLSNVLSNAQNVISNLGSNTSFGSVLNDTQNVVNNASSITNGVLNDNITATTLAAAFNNNDNNSENFSTGKSNPKVDTPAKRMWEKGTDYSTLMQTKIQFSQKNISNMEMCNESGETAPHTWLTLAPDFNEIDLGDSCGSKYYEYVGLIAGAYPVGLLFHFDPCPVEPYVRTIVADEIEYRFPVSTDEVSSQIGDSPLRVKFGSQIPDFQQDDEEGTNNFFQDPADSSGIGGNGNSGGSGQPDNTPTDPYNGPANLVPAGSCQSVLNTAGKDGAANITSDCGGCSFTSNADIDTDGAGIRDPQHTVLPGTSSGLNAQKHNFIVLPLKYVNGKATCPDVGKCAKVEYQGHTSYGVVGDCGPANKTGEVSTQMANDLGYTQNPNNKNGTAFGDSDRGVKYTVVPSKVSGLSKNTNNQSIIDACKQAVENACQNQSTDPNSGLNFTGNQGAGTGTASGATDTTASVPEGSGLALRDETGSN